MRDDRDRTIERLLARGRRADADVRGAEALRDPEACAETEMLAAYADGGLTADERTLVEKHAAACARCQDVLAAIAGAEPAAIAADAPRRWRVVSWLVPLAAAAAAVAIWIAVPGQRATEPDRVATARPDSQVPTPRPPDVPPSPSMDAVTRAPRLQADSSAPALRDQKAVQPRDAAKEKAAAVAAPAEGATARAERGNAADEARPKSQIDAAAPSGTRVATASPPSVEPRPGAAPPPAPAAPAPAAAAPATAYGTRAMEETARRRVTGLAETVQLSATIADVVSPDGVVRLRFVPGALVRTVDRSNDRGAKWETQQLGFQVALTSGACPSRDACWVAGRGGAVLLSTDASSWRRLPFRLVVDLTAIIARDGLHATVTAADGRTFVTEDGGMTWTLR